MSKGAERLEEEQRLLVQSAMMGLADALDSANGRAYFWYFYADNSVNEGPEGAGRRAVARDMLEAARTANWEGLQKMRDEHERPSLAAREAMREAENQNDPSLYRD